VEATQTITRFDRKWALLKGDRAKVFEAIRVTPEDPQIIGLEREDGKRMISIVCFENVPLKKV